MLPWDIVHMIIEYLDVDTLVNFNTAAGTQFSRTLQQSQKELAFPNDRLPKYYSAFRERASLAPYKARQFVVGEFSLEIPRNRRYEGGGNATLVYECTLFHFTDGDNGNDKAKKKSHGCIVWKAFHTVHTGYVYTGSTEEQWTWVYDSYGERFSLSTMRGFGLFK